MNPAQKKFLSGLANHVGLTIDFPDDAPIRIVGFEDGDILISTDQPDCELIFDILQNIAPGSTQSADFWSGRYPWFINRAYEHESAGDVAYKGRRVIRQKLNRKWRTSLWAMCVYPQIGCPREFQDFLQRHPEKMKFLPLVLPIVLYGRLKIRLIRFVSGSG